MTIYGYYPESLDGDLVGILLCAECAPHTIWTSGAPLAPVARWEQITPYNLPEVDSPLSCDVCLAFIPSRLTEDGERYVRAAVAGYLKSQKGRRDRLRAWAEEWDYLFPLEVRERLAA